MTELELQLKLVYAIIVAGKTAEHARSSSQRLFASMPPNVLPFDWFRTMTDGKIQNLVREARTGNYRKMAKALRELADAGLDLRSCGPAELEAICGIGPKTARFWLLWTRPGARYAALDVHVLRWLRDLGYDAPESTPSSPGVYRRLEKSFLDEATARGMTPRELDAKVWKEGKWGT